MHIPNADLKPEEMTTLELNGSYQFADIMKLEPQFIESKIEDMMSATVTDEPVSDFIEGSVGNIATTRLMITSERLPL